MKNRASRHGLMAAALAASIAALPASAHASASDLADWQANYGVGGYSMPGWMSSLLKIFG